MMRNSLIEPIPELELSAKLLDAAVDAIISGHLSLASKLIEQANMPEIMKYAIRHVGAMSLDVHRSTTRPECLPKEQRDPTRMPTTKLQNEIFQRDGWRCRFCDTKVINREARKKLINLFPEETEWHTKEFERHSALYATASSLDHVVPHGRGGKNEKSNFVTACYCCQFGRGEWTLEEVEVSDPRLRPPIVDNWDGLSRLLDL
jgi:5-methylcytosine-specific restriction endonuclease McrA